MLRKLSFDLLDVLFNRLNLRRKPSEDTKNISRISIPNAEGLDVLQVEEIMYCKGDGNYTIFHLEDGSKAYSTKSLKEYESRLPRNEFVRVHKSSLINLSYIKRYLNGRGGIVEMENGYQIEVARGRKEQLLKCLR